MKKKSVKLYVEGGGNQNVSLASDVRRGFHEFLTTAGFAGKLPGVVVCGGRQSAYEDYCTAVSRGIPVMLLVDSEAFVDPNFELGDDIHGWKPWEQLKSRKNQAGEKCDDWEKVGEDTDCQLMVQEMETWFLSDAAAVKSWFDPKFKGSKFPSDSEDIEKISKDRIGMILNAAVAETKKGTYDKGRDSFNILGRLDPTKLRVRAKWANRFLILLDEKTNSL